MDDDEFNRIVNGPLAHPLMPFRISRLVIALRSVVMSGGDKTAQALRDHCEQRTRQDEEPYDDC